MAFLWIFLCIERWQKKTILSINISQNWNKTNILHLGQMRFVWKGKRCLILMLCKDVMFCFFAMPTKLVVFSYNYQKPYFFNVTFNILSSTCCRYEKNEILCPTQVKLNWNSEKYISVWLNTWKLFEMPTSDFTKLL